MDRVQLPIRLLLLLGQVEASVMRRCILRQKGNRVGKREVEEEEEKEEEEEEEEEEKEEEDDGGIRRSHRTSSCPQRTCPR